MTKSWQYYFGIGSKNDAPIAPIEQLSIAARAYKKAIKLVPRNNFKDMFVCQCFYASALFNIWVKTNSVKYKNVAIDAYLTAIRFSANANQLYLESPEEQIIARLGVMLSTEKKASQKAVGQGLLLAHCIYNNDWRFIDRSDIQNDKFIQRLKKEMSLRSIKKQTSKYDSFVSKHPSIVKRGEKILNEFARGQFER